MYVEIKDLCFKYKNAKEDNLHNLNISIPKGQIIGVLGESGSGKSTVLRIIAGLEEAYSGSITIDKKTVYGTGIFIEPEKRGIGMVFQDYALFPHMTVAKNIQFGLKNMGKKDKEQHMLAMLKLVNLEDHQNKYPHELSGGQQQRVAIARALAPNPSILLLDEPFSNLDAHLRKQIRDDMNNILKKADTTTIFVTHDPEDVKAIANQVIILEKGRIIKYGSTDSVLG